MIPAAFGYLRATSIDEAVAALQEHGDEAKLLAGGHSLLPLMKLRLAFPELLVDIGRVDELRDVGERADGTLAIGAMTTHQAVMDNSLVRQHCGVLADVVSAIGDPQVRHRGTIGGAIAHGDAAGDLPAVLLALDATVLVQGPAGQREVAITDVFVDYLTTSLAPDELIVEVRVPKLDDDWSWNHQKFAQVAQAWAIVGSVALVRRADGTIQEARVGLTNMASVPIRATATERALVGRDADAITDAAGFAAQATDPPDDLHGSSDYRQHLARVLTERALRLAWG